MEKRILITRWLGSESQSIPIYDEASVSSARQRVREAGLSIGLHREATETVALIASELTHNQLSHSRQGYFSVRPINRQGNKGLEVTAADLGPGIDKPAQALREQLATERSLGAGLAAVSRLADEVELDTRMSEGTCVVARKFESEASVRWCDVAIMGNPFPGEVISGDDAVCLQSDSGFVAAVFDGLGHGPEARQASNHAIEVVSDKRDWDLKRMLLDLNQELTKTRGCAASVARFDRDTRTLECVSAGDVHSHLYHLKNAHFFAPTPFVLGAGQMPKGRLRIEKTSVEPGSLLVMFTDGLKSRTSLKGQLDVLRQPPIAIAQHLLENDSRPDDDALVLVARFHL
jgi:anti-sigma regulatory factor (Ser/Thr protein kinase)